MGEAPSKSTADLLRSFRDRILRLEEERKALADDVKDLYGEAKSQGFDVKALRRVVKDSRMDQTQRAAQRETESITDVYRATLGMLDGEPLSDDARRRYERSEEPPEPRREKPPGAAKAPEEAADDDPVRDEAPAEPGAEDTTANAAPAPSEQELEEEARAQGRDDFAAGRTILQNPFPAGDLRRAGWDEGWCEASGSDGMDLPDAWRRRPPDGDAARDAQP